MILSSRTPFTANGRWMSDEQLVCEEGSTFKLPGVDRRAHLRYPSGKAAASCFVTDAHGDLWPAQVRDISAGGISLLLFRPVELGTVVNVELINKWLRFCRRLPLRVLQGRSHIDGGYIIGGPFVRKLTPSELQALV